MYETVLKKLETYIGPKHVATILQLGRYFWVALIGLVVDFGTLVFLREVFGVNYLLAAAIGFTLGLLVNYLLSIRFVFKNSKLSSRLVEFGLFGVIGLIGLGILSLSMWLLTDVAHFHYVISKILATVLVYLWNFFGRKALYHD